MMKKQILLIARKDRKVVESHGHQRPEGTRYIDGDNDDNDLKQPERCHKYTR